MKHLLIFLCGKPLKWFTKPHNLAAALPPTLLSQHFHFLTFPTLPLCWLFCHQSSAPVHPSHLYCRSQLNCQSLREMVTDTPTSTSDVDFLSTNHLPSTLLITIYYYIHVYVIKNIFLSPSGLKALEDMLVFGHHL